MIDVREIAGHELTKSLVFQILKLKNAVWPSDDGTNKQCKNYLGRTETRPDRKILLVQEGETCIAHAETFKRTVINGGQAYEVGCLGGVCVFPDRRGEGLGRAVVEKAFGLIKTDGYKVFLFQTEVPGFYAKLGGKQVSNRFLNSQSGQPDSNPWWDENIMIYPSSYRWPEGDIDLNGEGY